MNLSKDTLATLFALLFGVGVIALLAGGSKLEAVTLSASTSTQEPVAVTYNQLITLSRDGRLATAVISPHGVEATTHEGAIVQAYHKRDPFLGDRLAADGARVETASTLASAPVDIWAWVASISAAILAYLLMARALTGRRAE